jgi:beta-galactosidase
VHVTVSGAGVLQAFGSADPATEERFDAHERSTFGGRALAIVRPTEVGTILVTARSAGYADVSIDLTVGLPRNS